ncbi:hypothetical protein [Humibacillus xanthopallidus]|uniref:hypothetical protein n=1 Tax=Humibacillus xanthopallidus TaxID=412689 RepID=UPI00115027CF|nr:hypothetical protein [Humibacillus xanthopallidus]
MRLSPGDVIEAIIDELVVGELGEQRASVRVDRLAPGSLFLDYGDAGRFRLDVVAFTDEG